MWPDCWHCCSRYFFVTADFSVFQGSHVLLCVVTSGRANGHFGEYRNSKRRRFGRDNQVLLRYSPNFLMIIVLAQLLLASVLRKESNKCHSEGIILHLDIPVFWILHLFQSLPITLLEFPCVCKTNVSFIDNSLLEPKTSNSDSLSSMRTRYASPCDACLYGNMDCNHFIVTRTHPCLCDLTIYWNEIFCKHLITFSLHDHFDTYVWLA